MKFNAEDQRLAHPQATLIPQPLWDALFRNELTDTEMMLLQADMTQDEEHVIDALQDLSPIYINTFSTFSRNQKLCAGVCILLGHPEYSEALIQHAERLTLSPDDLLNIAVMTHRNELISSIIAKYPNTKNWLGSAFANACSIGNIDALEKLVTHTPKDVYAMIEYTNYRAFVNAAENNQLPVMMWLMPKLDPDERQNILMKSNAFSEASVKGHLSVMEWLLNQLDDATNRARMIEGYAGFNPFQYAAQNGHLHIMEWIMQQSSPQKRHAMLTEEQNPAFYDAASRGHLHIMSWLFEQLHWNEGVQQALVKSNGYYSVFTCAAANGHLHILEWIMARLSLNKNEKEHFKGVLNDVFVKAAEHGHLDIMQWALRELNDTNEQQKWIDSSVPFIQSAANGHIPVLEWYAQQTRNKESKDNEELYFFRAFLQASENAQLSSMKWLLNDLNSSSNKQELISDAFQRACSYGHLPIMQWLIQQLDEQANKSTLLTQAFESAACGPHLPVMQWLVEQANFDTRLNMIRMIRKNTVSVFQMAARRGQLSTLKWLMEQLDNSTEQQNMLTAGRYEAFRNVGSLTVLKWLMKQVSDPNKKQMILNVSCYDACCSAVSGGCLDIIEWFMGQLPDNGQSMLQMRFHDVPTWAARGGHLHIIKFLLNNLDEPERGAMVIDAYERAVKRENNKAETDYLLSLPSLVAHIEKNIQRYEGHTQEYGERYIPLFVSKQLQFLRSQKNGLEAKHAHAVFDVDANQARVCFYMLRNLIRRNSDDLRDDMLFLLNIPEVKSLVHVDVTPGRSNELLRLALLTENRSAADILLAIPAVRELAAAHNYYRDEMRGQLDLRALARDRESSMGGLSKIEQKRLDKALERYQPVMTEQGIEPLFEKLQNDLVARYANHPPVVTTGDGRTIELPLQWQDWAELAKTLSAETRERALLAYYQHKEHTVFRYLSRPNPWMFEHAEYVNHDSNGMWSTFDQYKAEIVMFWLAAGDQGIAPIDGFTFETRMEHFVDELALLGRAHNWDQSRVKTNVEGVPVLDDEGHVITEEYDDLLGDKPSCYSGVKRRLFQSVLGHPLLKLLTMDAIRQELRDFVRDYFKQVITDKNRDGMREAWNTLCMGTALNEAQQESLAKLNIPQEKQTDFIKYLAQKYPGQFDDDEAREFRCYVEDGFKPTKIFEWHAVRFAAETSLEKLLMERLSPASILKAKSKLNQCGDAGNAIINEINCLQRGSKSSWSDLWAGSWEKLADIIAALNAVPSEQCDASFIRIILEDQNSALFQALFKPLSGNTEPADAKCLDEIKACITQFGSGVPLRVG
ncbi:MAG: hypothetical protein Q8R24_01875 [Legionellaceae bacterium]|nr:hypothetical protein [Legionellaceae bacterium]